MGPRAAPHPEGWPPLAKHPRDPNPPLHPPPPPISLPTDLNSEAGQGYCQGGFSAEFTQVGA